jgi:hypothetical protein
MDYGAMLGDSFAYAKDTVIGKWTEWLLLIIATLLLAIPLMGYSLKILRGENPAPAVAGWGTLLIDGLKYLVISVIYALPALIILFATLGSALFAAISHDAGSILPIICGVLLGFLLFVLVAFVTFLVYQIGIIRFSRTGSIAEAFRFRAIIATIGQIGWLPYIFASIIVLIVEFLVGAVLSVADIIPNLHFVLGLALFAPLVIFEARWFSRIYDSAVAA